MNNIHTLTRSYAVKSHLVIDIPLNSLTRVVIFQVHSKLQAFMNVLTPLITTGVNYLLKQEKWAQKELQYFAAKTIRIDLKSAKFTLLIDTDGMLTATNDEESEIAIPADVTLTIPASAVIKWLQHGQKGLQRDIKIDGNAELAATIARLAGNLRWEPEESAAQLIGDIPAHRLAKFTRELISALKNIGESSIHSTTNYLFDNQPTFFPQLVRQQNFDHFKTETASLRDDLARLEKRIDSIDYSQRKYSKQRSSN